MIQLPDELLPKVNAIIASIRKLVAELPKGEQLLPMAHIWGADGRMTLVGTPFSNDEEKDTVLAMLEVQCEKEAAEVFCYAIESWMLKGTEEEAREYMQNRHRYRSLSEHPKAVEVVVITLETRTQTWMGTADLVKVPLGRSGRTLGPIHWMGGGKGDVRGRFVGILNKGARKL